jgi:GAF domain-containing protein
MKAKLPKNEARRLEVLWQYDVLDTVPEEMFDDLADLAAQICDTPIGLISLVDENRQWFKARVGMTNQETARDISFCAHAILGNDVFVVPDATKDARFKHNPLVTAKPKIRFYAGAPLITPDGYAMGSLCVMDKVPRTLTLQQKQSLKALARHVITQLELRRHAAELHRTREAHLALERELELAQKELARLKGRKKSPAKR